MLLDTSGPSIGKSYKTIGEPEDLAGAQQLADDDKYQFQFWSLGLVGARPIEEKKGADKGIDGRLYFNDLHDSGATKLVLISVKGGHVTVNQLRDLRGVIERDKAAIGVFICIETPTKPMHAEAADAGFYTSPQGTKHARLQILTIEDLLGGKRSTCRRGASGRRSRKPLKPKRPVRSRTNFSEPTAVHGSRSNINIDLTRLPCKVVPV